MTRPALKVPHEQDVVLQGISLHRILLGIRRTWRRSLVIVLGTAVAAGVVGFLLPRRYTASASLTVDPGQLPAGNASVLGLASQLGLGTNLTGASPQFYADLVGSEALKEALLTVRLPLEGDDGLTTPLVFWGRSATPTAQSRERALKALGNRMTSSLNGRTGVISFSVTAPTPLSAKLLADSTLAALNRLVLSIRQRRASAEREFLEQRWADLEDSLRRREQTLRRFYDANRILSAPALQFEEARLRREVDRVQAIYAQIGSQLEQARIQEVRDTPVISVIDTPSLPARKSYPRIRIMILTATLFGAVVALILVVVEEIRTALPDWLDRPVPR